MLQQLKKNQPFNNDLRYKQQLQPTTFPSKVIEQIQLKSSTQHDLRLRQTGQSLHFTDSFYPSIEEFVIIKCLGKGQSSQVYLAMHKRTGFIGSLKILQKEQFQQNEREEMIEQLIDEIKHQSFCDHPNIIKLYTFFSDEQYIYLFMELGTNGQLFDQMLTKTFSEESISIIVREILNALAFVHQKGLLHRDLKPQNIVLTHGTAKLCDFGCSTKKEKNKKLGGTPLYWAPEIFKNSPISFEIDIWALGILTHELFFGDNPFEIRKEDDLFRVVQNEFRMKVGSLQLKTFTNLILKSEPQKRPRADQLLKHPFITKYRQLETTAQILTITQ